MEKILNEAIDNPSVYWLDPVTSFDLENTSDNKFDFPITLKAFLFRSFEKIANAPNSDNNVNQSLIAFYHKHGKPQHQTLSSKKIIVVKVVRPIEIESFVNARFKTARGAASSVFDFTVADLPYLNPFD